MKRFLLCVCVCVWVGVCVCVYIYIYIYILVSNELINSINENPFRKVNNVLGPQKIACL